MNIPTAGYYLHYITRSSTNQAISIYFLRRICANKIDTIVLSEKTIYNYLHRNILSADKFDLARAIGRKV